MQVGGRTVDDPLVLSPMVDVTDAAFRAIARAQGADITCSEMVSAAAIVHGNDAAWQNVQPGRDEHPYGVQFMTGDPDEMAQAIHALTTRILPDFIDINLGCPAPNILRSQAGGFLLRDPPLAGNVMRAAREAADDVGIRDVSVKLRTGPTDARPTYLDVGREAEDAGMAWATLHGRSVEQGYRGHADWNAIEQMVDALGIPVVGNGDLRTPADVVRMREVTGCAGFFIARAAMHDPTVFGRMRQALDGAEPDPAPGLRARVAIARRYLQDAPGAGVHHIAALRRQVGRFMAGAPGAKRLRVAMHDAQEPGELLALLDDALTTLGRDEPATK